MSDTIAMHRALSAIGACQGCRDHLAQIEAAIADRDALRAAEDARRGAARKRTEGSRDRKRKRDSNVTQACDNRVTGNAGNPPTPPFQEQDSASLNENVIKIGGGVSDPDARADVSRHVTWSQVAAMWEAGWQRHRSGVANPRTAMHTPKLEDAARMINEQARMEGIPPKAVMARVLREFWQSDAAKRCGYMPGAIAGCFPDLVSPLRGSRLNAPAKHEDFDHDDPDETWRAGNG